MGFITIPTKNTGDQLTASEFNQFLQSLKDGTLDIKTAQPYSETLKSTEAHPGSYKSVYINTSTGKIYSQNVFELIDDITPQLGGNLDMNSFNIEGVTPAEMSYVSGVTSAIQTQLDGKINAAYGDMYEHNDSGTVITITLADTYYGWITATGGVNLLTTFNDNATADRLTIASGGDGDYLVNFSANIRSGTTKTDYHMTVFKNGVEDIKLTGALATLDTADTQYGISLTGVITGLVATDYIDVRVKAPSQASTSITLFHATLSIVRIN